MEFVGGRLPESLQGWLSRLTEPIGLAIIDAEHTFDSVLTELSLLHDHLSPGGYFFCHDYRESDRSYEGTVIAIDLFARRFGYDRLALNPSTHQAHEVVWGSAILRKPLVQTPFAHAVRFRLGSMMRHTRKKLSLRLIAPDRS